MSGVNPSVSARIFLESSSRSLFQCACLPIVFHGPESIGPKQRVSLRSPSTCPCPNSTDHASPPSFPHTHPRSPPHDHSHRTYCPNTSPAPSSSPVGPTTHFLVQPRPPSSDLFPSFGRASLPRHRRGRRGTFVEGGFRAGRGSWRLLGGGDRRLRRRGRGGRGGWGSWRSLEGGTRMKLVGDETRGVYGGARRWRQVTRN